MTRTPAKPSPRRSKYVQGSASFDSTPVEVAASSAQTITGESTWAPGTEFTLRVRSSGDTEPRFYKTNESVTVQNDGTWTATFNFAEQAAGDTFTVSSNRISPALSADGEVVESVGTETATATATATATETATATATATEAPDTETEAMDTETEEPDTETTTTTTPGFGVAVALVALLAAALLAGRRE